tara:strand:+ start:4383 stop:5684 length:1302 start_codon:yes stop_codon:yes gene_type:complete
MLNKLRSYFFSITLLVTFSASAQDLEEIYQLVLQADPRLLMEEANLGINKAQEQQAFGNLLPQVTITSDWTETKRVTEQTSEDSYKGERHNLIITQPIINMPTYYRWKGSKDNVSRYEMSLKDIQSRVRFDTIERYFKLLSSMDALALVSEEKIMTEKKVQHVKALYKMQRIKITELYEVESRLDQLVSKEIDAKQEKDIALEGLSEITNSDIDYVSVLNDTVEFNEKVVNINEWVEKAISSNHTLKALQKEIDSAQNYISETSTEHYPVVGLRLTKQKSNIGFESTASQVSTTEVAELNVTIPLFTGGRITASTSEAHHRLSFVRAKLDKQRREVTKEARDAFLGVNAIARRVHATNKARQSARKSYQAMNRSFELGIATISDVLDAQNYYSKAKRDYQQSKYDYITHKAGLLHISGKLNDDIFHKVNNWLM